MDRETSTAKVQFIIAGTQKGGTSALDAYLREHPQICMARVKEVHFFDGEPFQSASQLDYSRYHSFFDAPSGDRIWGEATPIYMYWQNAPRRIWRYNPAMKLIMILRNPIDRAFSHWNMERERSRDPLTFWEAIRNETERCRDSLPFQHRVFSYVDRGFYTEQLRRIWSFFPRSQTLVLLNRDLKTEPQSVMDAACRFLGVDTLPGIGPKIVHARDYKTSLSRREWLYLKGVYEYEILALERMLGWDCSHWLREPDHLV